MLPAERHHDVRCSPRSTLDFPQLCDVLNNFVWIELQYIYDGVFSIGLEGFRLRNGITGNWEFELSNIP